MKKWLTIILFLSILGKEDVLYAQSKVKLLDWEKVNTLLPKYSKFTVVDFESGKKFDVQRRAGSRHADVQPLTAKDTKIMKEIYGGNWSWKRRAILVKHGSHTIAASMHGMPHGAGSLPNNFPGHFCIHFYGSMTHRTNSMDLSHKLMILKASGRLEEHFHSNDPYLTVAAYITGMKQQDPSIVSLLSLQKMNWERVLSNIENVKIRKMPVVQLDDIREDLVMIVPLQLEWFFKDEGRIISQTKIKLVRFSPQDPWKVDSHSFKKEELIIH